MCCYSPSISPSLFVLVLCRRLCSSFPLLHTRNVTHTLSPLVVLECVLVGQRLHNTELWVPSHVFVHHDDTQVSTPAEMTEEGTKVVQKSSSPVQRNDSSSAQWLQHLLNTSASLEEGGYQTAKLLRKCSQLHKHTLAQRKVSVDYNLCLSRYISLTKMYLF